MRLGHGLRRAVPKGAWQTLVSPVTFDTNSAGWGGYTLRQYFPPAVLLQNGGSKVRARLFSSTAAACDINKVYVGQGSYSGVQSASPVQMLSGGSATAVIGANSFVDFEASFTVNNTEGLILTAYMTGTSAVYSRVAASTSHICYYRSGDYANSINSSGFSSASAYVYLFGSAELFV